jgi:hypothetical protein
MVRGAAETDGPGVRAGAPPPGYGQQPPPPGYGQQPPPYQPPPPPAPEPPSPKLQCPECEFTFIVGQIETATCPNCGTEVQTGWAPDGE